MNMFTSILGKYAFIAATILLLLTSLVTATFYLTEEIRDDARRINLAGRQRMHIFHLANHAHFLLNNGGAELVNLPLHLAELERETVAYEQVLYGLKNTRQPCQSTAHESLDKQLEGLVTLWNAKQKPRLLQIMADPSQARKEGEKLCAGCHAACVDHFQEVDDFVFALTQHNEQVVRKFNLLRLGILAVSALAAILIAFFVKQQMIQPVLELHEAAVRLEQGDFSCRVVPRTNDEIGTLAQAFNRMATTLGQSFNEKEELVQQRTADLQTANEELKTFTYTVFHDLRAPLRAIQGFAGAIREDGQSLDPQMTDHVNNLTAAADYMDHLICDLLSYSQISLKDIHIARVDTGRLFKEVEAEMAAEIKKVDGQVIIEGYLPEVMANHGILTQITINLLSNALKFVKSGVQPRIRVWAEKTGDKARLCINDNGIGIAPADQKRIFDVFVRLHGMDSYPGTGIGLASVRRGIERLGGSCGVESVLGQGSTFWLELPVADQAWQAVAENTLWTENMEVVG
jgi:signal transduction histidine kinase